MRRHQGRGAAVLGVGAGLLFALLVLLGVLQYRWLVQVASTLAADKRVALQHRGATLSDDLGRELTRAFVWFQIAEAKDEVARAEMLAQRWQSWRQAGRHVALVAEVHLIESLSDAEPPLLSRLDPSSGALTPATWPPDGELLARYFASGGRLFGLLPTRDQKAGPLLAVPLIVRRPAPGTDTGAVVLRLDRRYLSEALLPALAAEHLRSSGNGEDVVALLSDGEGGRIFGWPAGVTAVRAEHAPLVISPLRPDLAGSALLTGMQPPRSSDVWPGFGPPSPPPGQRGRRAPPGSPGDLERRFGGPPPIWQLSLAYAAGPVDAVVTGLRRRNLALAFSILALLAGALVALVLAVRRAQALAARQRQLMASVSHELRTPLAVINSAAKNLRDGTIDDGVRVREYGALIHAESQRLHVMVDDVLRLAAGQDLQESLRKEEVDLRDVVDSAVDSFHDELAERGGRIERQDPPGAPIASVDPDALRQAVENVIGNAIKYGGDRPEVSVEIRRGTGAAGLELQIAVVDRGLGIPREELGQLFEPFFRGRDAMTRQIRGTGLGLSLVARIMKAHGGRVSVQSAPGRGSAFVLHLPAGPVAAAGATSGLGNPGRARA